MLKTFKNAQRGFTLIELLVVIAIIGILSGIVVTSLGGQRARARDSRRVSEIQSAALALQLYYDSNGTYPDSLDTLTTAGLMAKNLRDPSSGVVYPYDRYTSASWGAATAVAASACAAGANACNGFHLGANLETQDTNLMSGADLNKGLTITATVTVKGSTTLDCSARANIAAGANSNTPACFDQVNH